MVRTALNGGVKRRRRDGLDAIGQHSACLWACLVPTVRRLGQPLAVAERGQTAGGRTSGVGQGRRKASVGTSGVKDALDAANCYVGRWWVGGQVHVRPASRSQPGDAAADAADAGLYVRERRWDRRREGEQREGGREGGREGRGTEGLRDRLLLPLPLQMGHVHVLPMAWASALRPRLPARWHCGPRELGRRIVGPA